MNIKTSLLAAALGASLCTFAPDASANDTHRYVVEFKAGTDLGRVADLLTANNIAVVHTFQDPLVPSLAVDINLLALPDIQVLRAQLPEVTSYYRDVQRFPLQVVTTPIDDETLPDGEIIPWGIQAVDSLGVAQGGSRKVCIIDSGLSYPHEDIQIPGVTGEDEGAGHWDNSDGAGMHDHGTHVAGTIAALGGNGKGVVGVNQYGNLELHNIRMFDASAAAVYASDLAGAIQDCGDAGANVISMSLGGNFSSKAEERVTRKLDRQGVLIIAASGNGSSLGGVAPKNDYATHSYPASYDAVMSIAAYDNNLERASFSQYTAQVELAGPGVGVLSTIVGDQYGSMSGTSMATPHVSGVAALVWSHNLQCTNDEIRTALKASALDVSEPGPDYYSGAGLVQAKAALDYLNNNPCKGKGGGSKLR